MTRPENPILLAIENDQADANEALRALADVTMYYGQLDEPAVQALLLQAFQAIRRLKRRADARHQAFSETYHKR